MKIAILFLFCAFQVAVDATGKYPENLLDFHTLIINGKVLIQS